MRALRRHRRRRAHGGLFGCCLTVAVLLPLVASMAGAEGLPASAAAADEPPAPAAEQPSSALADSLRAAERAFAASFAERDLERFAGFVAEDAVFFGGTQVFRGREAVKAAWAGWITSPEPPFSWEPDRVEVLDSGALGLSTGPVRDPAGQVTNRFISTWRRKPDGGWEVVFDIGAPVCPPR